MKIRAQAAMQAKGSLGPWEFDSSELGPYDVDVEISHCGVCYSDVHLIDDDWKKSVYPFVPGHEIVGRVVRRGNAVTHIVEGDRVGIGWQRSACLMCDVCLRGLENLCPTQEATCVKHHGGLAERIIADARFALPIPEGIDSAAAAPLLCGGVTVYSPMRRFGVDATKTVGVIGIGGLGHMAIAIARALGAEVVAFSSSADKREEAMRMGAHRFAISNDVKDIKRVGPTIDLLLSTVHVKLDWISYLQTLKPNGTLCFVGAMQGFFQIPPLGLMTQRSIVMSEIGNRAAIVDLLRICARHKIEPQVEVTPMAEAQAAIDRLRQNKVRYRAVLANG